ncbi:hypothetical protein JTB14_031401 [Gonioctena quinquepunctata]|nr:hypothetical protein JTB14_031401 [Gonioctena quinquepunctata]
MFLPIRTTELRTPEELSTLIHCTCFTSNCNKICGCRKTGMRCEKACQICRGETCLNAADIVGDDNDDEDSSNDLADDDVTQEIELIIKLGYLDTIIEVYDQNNSHNDDDDDNAADDNMNSEKINESGE